MLLKSIKIANFLSFGETAEAVELEPLNVVIGPNGSGKSNLIEAIDLIRSAPKDLLTPIRDGGGVRDWLRKGASERPPAATIDAVLENRKGRVPLRYVLSFTEVAQRFEILDERVENETPDAGHDRPYFTIASKGGMEYSTSRASSAACSTRRSTRPHPSCPNARIRISTRS